MPSGCNAVKVTETANVSVDLPPGARVDEPERLGLLDRRHGGRVPHPLDVEMVNDTTGSMDQPRHVRGTPTDVPTR